MKKHIFLLLLLLPFILKAQDEQIDTSETPSMETLPDSEDDIANINPKSMAMDSVNSIKAAFGMTQIGGQTYVGLRFQPEFTLSKFGFGLDIPIQFNIEDKSFRDDEFKGGIEVLRMIRYFRFGRQKVDPFYIRLGDMTGTSLGFGTLVNNYSNSPSFENRKFGVNLDVHFKKIFGLEAIYSDIKGFNLLGIRPYIRPFRTTKVPIVKTIEFGYGYVTDKAENAEQKAFLSNGISASNFDVGITFLNTSFIKLMGFGQTSEINKINSDSLTQRFLTDNISYDKGQGSSFGLSSQMKIGGNIFLVDTRIERLSYKDNYIPQFFDAIYEINKDEKILSLGTAKESNGIYGSLSMMLLDKIRIGGALLMPDNVSIESPALIQFNLKTVDLVENLTLGGSYIKGGLSNLNDAFILDDRSLANVNMAYSLSRFLIIGAEYRWTFARLADNTLQATDYFRPYFALNFPIGGGNKKSKEKVIEDAGL